MSTTLARPPIAAPMLSSFPTMAAVSSTARRPRSPPCQKSSTPSAARTEVLFDGGIRSGQDVIRALALGARACLIGRAFLYGLGAGGEAGVKLAIEIIRKEMDVTMALTGRRTVKEIDRSVLMT